MINIDLHQASLDAYKQSFLDNGIVRINEFLQQDQALNLANFVSENIEFKNAFYLDNQNKEASDQEIGQLAPEQRRQLYMQIYQLAAQGKGFLYGRHKVDENSKPLITQYLQALNDNTCINFINELTNSNDLKSADGQVTRYRVGDFLTRHNDDVTAENRKFAYVLSLSPQWHPDWGGLLQFFENDGTPTQSYMPVFNTLTLFDVKKVHSVTSIAPFSPQSRFSITGWFRN
ncbi:2OG-Fe(II) oxygenase [Colwellia sp. MEBiC06753]